MISDRMQMMIEYRDVLREIVQLEGQIIGTEEKPKGGARKKIDRGKLFALKKAGWSTKDIARELGCTEGTVYDIVSVEGDKHAC